MNANMAIKPHARLKPNLEATPSNSSTGVGLETDVMLSLDPGSRGEILTRELLAPAKPGYGKLVSTSPVSFDAVVVDKVTLLKVAMSNEARPLVLSALSLLLVEDG